MSPKINVFVQGGGSEPSVSGFVVEQQAQGFGPDAAGRGPDTAPPKQGATRFATPVRTNDCDTVASRTAQCHNADKYEGCHTMDGTLAAIFFIVGLTDMGLNTCPTGCLAPAPATARLDFQASDVWFQEDSIGSEFLLGYDAPKSFGPFQAAAAFSSTETGDLWVGIGAKWTTERLFDSPLFIESSFMPGIYLRDVGPDIGGNLHFRSALGIGYRFDNGASVLVSYDHRSNGDTLSLNPGLETLALRIAIPLP
jgi:hypothetical protein